jgi:hypothetical protein
MPLRRGYCPSLDPSVSPPSISSSHGRLKARVFCDRACAGDAPSATSCACGPGAEGGGALSPRQPQPSAGLCSNGRYSPAKMVDFSFRPSCKRAVMAADRATDGRRAVDGAYVSPRFCIPQSYPAPGDHRVAQRGPLCPGTVSFAPVVCGRPGCCFDGRAGMQPSSGARILLGRGGRLGRATRTGAWVRGGNRPSLAPDPTVGARKKYP